MSRNGRSSPLLLGFEEIERLIDRASKTAGDGYPPYNIERLPRNGSEPERLKSPLLWPASHAKTWKFPSRRTSW